jgi:hypothetical protein
MDSTATTASPEKVLIKGKCDLCNKEKELIELEISADKKIRLCPDCIEKLKKHIEKPGKRGMYNKLQALFEAIPQQQEQVALNFSEFTDIMGHTLPKTALKDRTWWANTEGPHGSSWLSAGWKLENIYMNTKVAVFRRKAENPLRNIPKYMKAFLTVVHMSCLHQHTFCQISDIIVPILE